MAALGARLGLPPPPTPYALSTLPAALLAPILALLNKASPEAYAHEVQTALEAARRAAPRTPMHLRAALAARALSAPPPPSFAARHAGLALCWAWILFSTYYSLVFSMLAGATASLSLILRSYSTIPSVRHNLSTSA